MATIFPSRGCIVKVDQQVGNSATAFYKLAPAISSDDGSPVLILGATVKEQDVISPKSTLDDYRIVFLFGKTFGSIHISGAVLLGLTGKGLAGVQDYFEYFRVANFKQPIQVSTPGGKAYNFLLVSMETGMVDPQFGNLPFTFTGVITDSN